MKKTTTNTGYRIDHVAQEIVITKKFGKEASQIGTDAFKEMQKLRKECEGYNVVYKTIEKNDKKESFEGLTIKEMRRFLGARSEAELETFNKVVDIASCKQGKYAIVKKWFLDNYKEEYKAEIANIKAQKEAVSATVEEERIADVLAEIKAPKENALVA